MSRLSGGDGADPLAVKPDRLKQVPAAREVRDRILLHARQVAEGLDKTQPLDKHELEAQSRIILKTLNEPEDFLGWTMVVLASSFWRDQVAATPFDRRLLLLPHCLRDVDSCPGHYNELGLVCKACGACKLRDLRARAERLGYNVLIAEGSPVVMQIILSGHADALIGVSCLNVLERSLDKILLAGIPCMAIPLFESTCRDTQTDTDWVEEMIDTPYRPLQSRTQTYVHLLRCARRMFQPEELEWLTPRARGGPTLSETEGLGLAAIEPVASTEAIAYDFLLAGGKRARPFVTLAAYDAMTGGTATGVDGEAAVGRMPEAVRRVALAIEVFHKASLVHDDIEDDDPHRYGRAAIHRRFGIASAINVGDYLIGLGYRLVAEQRDRLDSSAVADILAQLAEAHTRLCEGQGAELAWRGSRRKLAPLDVVKIYALKTAPAFEAALYAGIRLAGDARAYRQPVGRYARHLGVAFQIRNDLDDWQTCENGRPDAGGDVLGGRPTLLLALALDNLNAAQRRELMTLITDRAGDPVIASVRQLYEQAGVFDQARALIDKYHHRAREVADDLEPDGLRHLLHYLADNLLE